ncbi:MAG: hypothetical protein WDO17_11920 [Alphaproteobacteria bacterium]
MMKILTAASLAVGLVALSLPAHATGSTASLDKTFKSTAASQYMQLARNENPGGGMYKKSKKKAKKESSNTTTPSMQMARNENPGGGMYKKSKKKKKSA